MSKEKDLDQVRAEIDNIDRELQELINRRARCAQDVADIKQGEVLEDRERGDSEQEAVFYRPEREAQILNRIKDRNDGPLSGENVAHIFREIMSACLALEKPMQVAYLGPEGTFTQAATIKHFGHAVISIPQGTIDSVFNQEEAEDWLAAVRTARVELALDPTAGCPGSAPVELRHRERSQPMARGMVQ